MRNAPGEGANARMRCTILHHDVCTMIKRLFVGLAGWLVHSVYTVRRGLLIAWCSFARHADRAVTGSGEREREVERGTDARGE